MYTIRLNKSVGNTTGPVDSVSMHVDHHTSFGIAWMGVNLNMAVPYFYFRIQHTLVHIHMYMV